MLLNIKYRMNPEVLIKIEKFKKICCINTLGQSSSNIIEIDTKVL